jgi:flagellar protein FliS
MVASSYAKIYRSNSVLTATPGQLVLMLFDGVLNSLAVAKEEFKRPTTDFRRNESINRQLWKAQRIINELRGTLNFEVGGDFAPLMHRLYDYYNRRLLEANLQKRVEPIVEIEGLLKQLRDSWADMLRRPETARVNQVAPVVSAGAEDLEDADSSS